MSSRKAVEQNDRSVTNEVDKEMSIAVDPEISLTEIIELVNSDQWSLSYSPLLNAPNGTGGTILRSAAPHKGFEKRENETFDEYTSRLESNFDYGGELASGLESARSMAQEKEDVDGLMVATVDGVPRLLPRSAVELAEEGSSKTVSDKRSVSSAAEGQRVIRQMGGNNNLPQVY